MDREKQLVQIATDLAKVVRHHLRGKLQPGDRIKVFIDRTNQLQIRSEAGVRVNPVAVDDELTRADWKALEKVGGPDWLKRLVAHQRANGNRPLPEKEVGRIVGKKVWHWGADGSLNRVNHPLRAIEAGYRFRRTKRNSEFSHQSEVTFKFFKVV
jgi:hypothetical protein